MSTIRKQPARPTGFTLVEMLVVIAIITLITVATLPVVVPAYQHRAVTQATLLLQSMLSAARDQAVKDNEPRGIRLLPDPVISPPGSFNPLVYNRVVPIELAPDYSEGMVRIYTIFTDPLDPVANNAPPYAGPATTSPYFDNAPLGTDPRIGFQEQKFVPSPTPPPWIPTNPTQWFWNIRQGDKIQVGSTGRVYTIAGPMTTFTSNGLKTGTVVNPERFINFDPPGGAPYRSLPSANPSPNASNTTQEFVFVVNGQDDDGDGWIDEGFDGIDNDGDGVTDPGFNGLDDNGNGLVDELIEQYYPYTSPPAPGLGEYEPESYTGPQFSGTLVNQPYVIQRRPVPVPSAREVTLPGGVVIDATTSLPILTPTGVIPATRERSRLPVDPYSGYVDILISPNGQVLQAAASANAAQPLPFYHFWLTEREDVYRAISVPAPSLNYVNTGLPYFLPMPPKTPGYDLTPASATPPTVFLKGDRRLVTLFTRTGLVTVNSLQVFDGTVPPQNFGIDRPFVDPQNGTREAP